MFSVRLTIQFFVEKRQIIFSSIKIPTRTKGLSKYFFFNFDEIIIQLSTKNAIIQCNHKKSEIVSTGCFLNSDFFYLNP